MSEQTPDTDNGISDAQEPSMEDILASIRKIIADDDQQEQNSAFDAEPQDMGSLVTQGDVSEMVRVEDTLDLDVVEEPDMAGTTTDIDALLGDMDDTGAESLAIPDVMASDATPDALEDILDLEIPMTDDVTADSADVLDAVIESDAAAIDVSIDSGLTLEDDVLDLAMDTDLLLSDDAVAEIADVEPEADATSGLAGGVMAALGLGGAAVAAASPETTSEHEGDEGLGDDLSLMLDNMLEDTADVEELALESELIEPESVVDSTDDLLDEIDLSSELMDDLADTEQTSDPDMDLVKSLMADLTEEPLHDDLEGELEGYEGEALAVDIDDDDGDSSSDYVMDEILSMTLDDEIELSEELAIPEIETADVDVASLDVASLEEASIEVDASEPLSLKDIAAAAEADAKASEGDLPDALLAGLGAAAIGGGVAVAASAQDQAPESEIPENEISELEALEVQTELDDVDNILSQLDDLLPVQEDPLEDLSTTDTLMPEEPVHITPENLIEETPPMARAKKTDAIIDEVTEEATAGAFASLTNVVETKAVRAERGDRIGDLVTEALQPMLKEWLDANLKGIVERAVTKEVKRISSGK